MKFLIILCALILMIGDGVSMEDPRKKRSELYECQKSNVSLPDKCIGFKITSNNGPVCIDNQHYNFLKDKFNGKHFSGDAREANSGLYLIFIKQNDKISLILLQQCLQMHFIKEINADDGVKKERYICELLLGDSDDYNINLVIGEKIQVRINELGKVYGRFEKADSLKFFIELKLKKIFEQRIIEYISEDAYRLWDICVLLQKEEIQKYNPSAFAFKTGLSIMDPQQNLNQNNRGFFCDGSIYNVNLCVTSGDPNMHRYNQQHVLFLYMNALYRNGNEDKILMQLFERMWTRKYHLSEQPRGVTGELRVRVLYPHYNNLNKSMDYQSWSIRHDSVEHFYRYEITFKSQCDTERIDEILKTIGLYGIGPLGFKGESFSMCEFLYQLKSIFEAHGIDPNDVQKLPPHPKDGHYIDDERMCDMRYINSDIPFSCILDFQYDTQRDILKFIRS